MEKLQADFCVFCNRDIGRLAERKTNSNLVRESSPAVRVWQLNKFFIDTANRPNRFQKSIGRDNFKSYKNVYINTFQEDVRNVIHVVFKLMKRKRENYTNYTNTIPCNDGICSNNSFMSWILCLTCRRILLLCIINTQLVKAATYSLNVLYSFGWGISTN